MSSASSSRCALRRQAPPFPLILCPECGRQVKQSRSGTPEHPGWVFFKCKQHGFGCNFWHWELEYITYLIENNYIRGDAAIEAYGWAEERREELELRKQEASVTRVQGEQMQLMRIYAEMKQIVLLLKMAIVLLAVLSSICALLVVKK